MMEEDDKVDTPTPPVTVRRTTSPSIVKWLALRFPTSIRRLRRSIAEIESGRWPFRMSKRTTINGNAQGQSQGGWISNNKGLIFVICVFVVFMQAGFLSGRTNSAEYYPGALRKKWLSTETFQSPFVRHTQVLDEHPIPKLMLAAEGNFRDLLSRQSRTLAEAVVEYKRRYKMDPPKGFDQWWQFTREHDVKIVDDFDGMVEDLSPFWDLTGEEFRRRAHQAGLLPSIDLVRVQNGNGSVIHLPSIYGDSEVGARAKGFKTMLGKFVHTLPDMEFPINAKAEGRILVPWEHIKYPNSSKLDSSGGVESMVGANFTPDWRGDSNVWESFRRSCSPTSPSRRLFSSTRAPPTSVSPGNLFETHGGTTPGMEFSFTGDTDGDFDFCANPWAHNFQGHFFSDWRTIPVLYPILSPAKSKGYLDIRIPSHYYYGSTQRYTYGWDPVNMELKEVDDMEVPWEKKNEKIFWRGATTGGGSSPPGFARNYQRHRLLRMTSDQSGTKRTITFADPPGSDNWISEKVPALAVNHDIMDVAFVKAVGYYPEGPQALVRDHRFDDAVPLGRHWAYKYLMDVDGMSYSGRFMALLASDSAVLKSTVYLEYFSDWIEPWLHYVPISSSYKELYNIHAFFSGAPTSALQAINSTTLELAENERKSVEGDRRLRRIARAGKQWKKTIGRTIDMEAYVYRLCLEYARLWSDDRDSMVYKP